MSRARPIVLLVLAALGMASAQAWAQVQPDRAREQRWAAQILPSLVVGDPVYLEADGGSRFLALYARPERPRAAVLLLHGPGLHPNHGITGELRVDLTDRGYTTLSLQLPVLGADQEAGELYRELFPEAARRIGAGLAYLRAQGATRIAVVSHAMGSGMFYAYWRERRDPGIAAWVALSFYGVFEDIARAPFPVFDLYGASDYRGIRGNAGARAEVLATVRGSRQLALREGGRFLAGGEAGVRREVPAFLDAVLPGN